MAAFDIDKFMDMGTDIPGDTKFEPVPQGAYPGIIEDVKPKNGVSQKTGQPWVGCDITYKLNLPPEVQKKLGRENATVRQSFFLDIDGNGGLDMSAGKNIRLNQVREAAGLSKGFTFGKLRGAGPVLVQVTMRPDKDNPDVIYNDVSRVGKLK